LAAPQIAPPSLHDALPIFILVFPCIAGGAYIIATTSVSQFMAALERMGVSRNFSITLAVTLRFLPALRQEPQRHRQGDGEVPGKDRKSTRLNSSHVSISYA